MAQLAFGGEIDIFIQPAAPDAKYPTAHRVVLSSATQSLIGLFCVDTAEEVARWTNGEAAECCLEAG